MTALHELTGQLLEIANNDDLPPDAIRDTLEAMEGSIQQKALSLANWAMDMEGDIGKIDAEIERLKSRKTAIANRRESLNEYLRDNMLATGIKKIQCPLFTITIVEGRESVAISDESQIPDEFMRVKTDISPDKSAIAKAIKEGIDIPGAALKRGQPSIRIK